MIKLPRKYTSVGVDLRIKVTQNNLPRPDGDFDFKDEVINVVVDKSDTLEVLNVLIHEEIEATLVGLGCTYVNHNGDKRFSLNHNTFCAVAAEVAKGVHDLLRANGVK